MKKKRVLILSLLMIIAITIILIDSLIQAKITKSIVCILLLLYNTYNFRKNLSKKKS